MLLFWCFVLIFYIKFNYNKYFFSQWQSCKTGKYPVGYKLIENCDSMEYPIYYLICKWSGYFCKFKEMPISIWDPYAYFLKWGTGVFMPLS